MRAPCLPSFKPEHRMVLQAMLIAAILGAACPTLQAQEALQAVRLREIKDLDKLDPGWIMGICNLPGLTCNKVEMPRLLERKTKTGGEYYALTVGRMLSHLAMKAPGQWELLNRWSFAEYPLAPGDDDSDSPPMIDIHPALYPAGPSLWAVAVLQNQREAYSGGGAEFITADFVVLDPKATEIGEKQRLFAEVPFSCSKMIRACFSQEDYKKSPHCHDESSGFLTLKYATSATGGFYQWTATWNETVWPAGVKKSAQTKNQTVAILKPGKPSVAPDTFPFCEGGPLDAP